jgi:hypothetical protein
MYSINCFNHRLLFVAFSRLNLFSFTLFQTVQVQVGGLPGGKNFNLLNETVFVIDSIPPEQIRGGKRKSKQPGEKGEEGPGMTNTDMRESFFN